MKKYITGLLLLLAALPAFCGIYEINIPTRLEGDKKYLAADLYAIDTTIAKPVIFIQTPYNKNYYRTTSQLPTEAAGLNFEFDTASYNFVIMDWRGFYANRDADTAQYDRGLDGYDAIEWMASQKWCNGKVGSVGGSALGLIQFQTAKHKPPHYVCAVPSVKDYKTVYENYYYGGVFRLEHVQQLKKLGFFNEQGYEYIRSQYKYNLIWKAVGNANDYPEDFNIPMLLISGWFDNYPSDVMRAFHDIRNRSAEEVRDKHKLIFGPWLHSSLGETKQGELEYPEAAGVPLESTMQFLDYWLLGAKNGWPLIPVIKYFIMGDNTWKTTEDWYKVTNNELELYLYPNGMLENEPVPPTFKEVEPDSIIYDPGDPSPTIGGSRFNPFDKNTPMGPMDIRETVESRNDVLIYQTEVLNKPITLTGKAEIKLFVSSDRTDTDFGVRLCDVYPDGRSVILTQGIQRMRFRDAPDTEEFMTPGEVYEVAITLQDLAQTFREGHRLKIVVSCSDYPMFDINRNDGGDPSKPGDTLIAVNKVYHDQTRTSKIILPILTTTDTEDETTVDENNFSIYPNPVMSGGIINLSGLNSGEYGLEFYNITGLLLLKKKINTGGVFRLSTAGFANGVYFIKIVRCTGDVYCKSFVVD